MKKQFRSFKDARKFVHTLNLKNQKDWRKYTKSEIKPDNIPVDPSKTYKNKGWISQGDWLGTGNVAPQKRKFLSFNGSRTFVRNRVVCTIPINMIKINHIKYHITVITSIVLQS